MLIVGFHFSAVSHMLTINQHAMNTAVCSNKSYTLKKFVNDVKFGYKKLLFLQEIYLAQKLSPIIVRSLCLVFKIVKSLKGKNR